MIPIHQTAKDFAVTAVKLGKRLQTQEREFNISNQLIRSATSISANLHEARSAESLKDYTHKVFIAFKEASETKYWINIRGSATFATGIRCFATLVATPHSCVPSNTSEVPSSPHPSTPTIQ